MNGEIKKKKMDNELDEKERKRKKFKREKKLKKEKKSKKEKRKKKKKQLKNEKESESTDMDDQLKNMFASVMDHDGTTFQTNFANTTDEELIYSDIDLTDNKENDHERMIENAMLMNSQKEDDEKTIYSNVVVPTEQVNGQSMKCSFCDRCYSKQSNLKKHENSEHKGLRFACPFCDVFTVSKDTIQKHIKKLHPSEFQDTEPHGRYYWITNDGIVLSRDAKLLKISQLEKELVRKKKMSDELRNEIHGIERDIQTFGGPQCQLFTTVEQKHELNVGNGQLERVQLTSHQQMLFESYGLSTANCNLFALNSHPVSRTDM